MRSALRQPRSVPHLVGYLDNESRLVRLLFAHQHAPVDRREEPASGRDTQLVQIGMRAASSIRRTSMSRSSNLPRFVVARPNTTTFPFGTTEPEGAPARPPVAGR
jgi:hypothetical protein